MSNYVILLLFGLVLSEQDIREHCRFSCRFEYDYEPVCGTDNQTYINSCELHCISGSDKNDLTVRHIGPCCNCRDIYDPLCASDGKTYKNICEFNCAVQKGAMIYEKHSGICPCECSENEKTEVLCGSNGLTYANRCQLNCAASESHNLYAVHDGSCNCGCEGQQFNRTCGTDCRFYNNKCEFECQRKKVGGVIYEAPNYYCECGKEYKPVCGSDQITYDNPCLLFNAIGVKPGMYLANIGECYESHCGCGDDINLVCASNLMNNNLTFRNRCEMECGMRVGKQRLNLVKYGYCYSSGFMVQSSVLLVFGIAAVYIKELL